MVTIISKVNCAKNCTTIPDYKEKNAFIDFFDDCLVDTTSTYIIGSVSDELLSLFNLESYPAYVTVVIFAITLLFFHDTIAPDDAARGNCFRLHCYALLIRLGLVISMVPWLWAAFRQKRPCMCDAGGFYVPVNQDWGMPSGGSFGATVVGLHFIQFVNIPIGIIFMLLVGSCAFISGQYSLGQAIAGVLFGLAIHGLTTRTPFFMRAVDLILTIIGGLISLLLAKEDFPREDYSFAILFLVGIAWQFYGMALVFVTYDWEFLRAAIRRSATNLHQVDFMYYRPLNANPTADLENTKYPYESLWITLITVVLIIVLCGLRVISPYMNDIIKGK